MSEDRLEKALQEMKQEDVDAGTLDAARARVWDKVAGAAGAGCAEFRPDFRAYLSGELGEQPPRPDGRPSQPLPRVPRRDGRAEGRTAGDRHAAAVLLALDAMGIAGRGGRRWSSRSSISDATPSTP